MRNFINMVDQNVPLYHGTTSEFEGIPTIPKHSGIYGRGIYFYTTIRNAQSYGRVIECTAEGKLATEKMLDDAIAVARSEGYTGPQPYHRATDILIEKGYVGIRDRNIVCIYVRDALTLVNQATG